jgi:hypothetical protein
MLVHVITCFWKNEFAPSPVVSLHSDVEEAIKKYNDFTGEDPVSKTIRGSAFLSGEHPSKKADGYFVLAQTKYI